MPQCNGSAIDIHNLMRQPKGMHDRQHLYCEGFIDLCQMDVFNFQPGFFQCLLTASIGPSPNDSWFDPGSRTAVQRANGFKPARSRAPRSPELERCPVIHPDEFPAVTVPACRNEGFSRPSFSKLESRLGRSSSVT